MSNITETIIRLLSGFVDQFKMKNPQAFAITVTILLGVYTMISNGLDNGALNDTEVSIFGMTFFILSFVEKAIVFLLAVLGAHTPQRATGLVELPKTPVKWTKGDEYHLNDKATQHGATFVCIKQHIAEAHNQPLLDVENNGEFWKEA